MARPRTSADLPAAKPAPAWDAKGQPSLRAARRAVAGATAHLAFHAEATGLAPDEIQKVVGELIAVLETRRDALLAKAAAP